MAQAQNLPAAPAPSTLLLSPAARPPVLAALNLALLRGFEGLLEWQRRARTRHEMARLSDYDLKDMGLSRADLAGEAGKPFWRA